MFTEKMGLVCAGPTLSLVEAALADLERAASTTECDALKAVSLNELKQELRERAMDIDDEATLHLSREFTRRGIAPAFRGIPLHDDPWWAMRTDEANFILLCADLEWITARYPDHKPEWPRLQSVFDPKKLVSTAQYLHWDGRREPGQIANGMKLSEDMQRELAWVQHLHVHRWCKRLQKRVPLARAAIQRDVLSRPWKSKASKEETIQRRADIWQCAELGRWKPQRTADFYAMLTGHMLTRGIASVQLGKLPKVPRYP